MRGGRWDAWTNTGRMLIRAAFTTSTRRAVWAVPGAHAVRVACQRRLSPREAPSVTAELEQLVVVVPLLLPLHVPVPPGPSLPLQRPACGSAQRYGIDKKDYRLRSAT